MKKSDLVIRLKNYIQENEIKFNSFDNEIFDSSKDDFFKLSKYFVLIFDNFRNVFIDFEDEKVIQIIKNMKEISLEILFLNQSIDNIIKKSYGKFESSQDLIQYIKNNYYSIIDFCNLYNDVFNSHENKLKEIIDKLKDNNENENEEK